MMNTLDNCPKCGKLFVKGMRNVCPECHKEVEAEFQKVYSYVRQKENRKSSIYEVSEATEVTVKQIREFIREGKLSLSDFPNLAYPCDSCGENLILQGNICESCRQKISKAIKTAFDSEGESGQVKPGTGFLNKELKK